MSTKRPQPTPAIQQSIVAYVRAGGFPHVAAEAAGVSVELFDHWMRLAERPRASAKLRQFAEAVRQAAAQARLAAETEMRANKPLDWLRSGPGRPTPAGEGWTGPARPAPVAPEKSQEGLSPEGQLVVAAVMKALAPFPEASAAVAEALQSISLDSAPKIPHRRSSRA